MCSMQISRKENESNFDYHKRLIYGKLEDKTLADIDYSELSEYVYGQPYSSDVARRMMYGSKKTLDLIGEQQITPLTADGVAEEIDRKMDELQKERQRFYDQRREYNKLISADGRADHLYKVIQEAADKLNESVGLLFPVEHTIDFEDNEAVVVFSDWHYGMKTSNVFNEYNTDICKQRIANTVSKMTDRIQLHRCRVAHVVVLGDLFHGSVHVTARVASDEAVCEQLMHASELLAQAIYEISKHVEEVRVYITYGNHARVVQNKSESMHKDNLERVVNWWLIERFKDNDNITVMPDPENEFIMLDVCGHGFCASHGDLDSVRVSPRVLSTLFHKKLGVDIEYILLGDKHHRESHSEMGITAMLCGSLCGTDDYANERRLFDDPSQMLLIVNADCGVDAEYRIKCD